MERKISITLVTADGEMPVETGEPMDEPDTTITAAPEPIAATTPTAPEAAPEAHGSLASVKARITHASALVQRLVELAGHWDAGVYAALSDALIDIHSAEVIIADKGPAWIPPRKPTVRGWQTLAVGASCTIADRSAARYSCAIRGASLKLVTIEGELASVQRADGIGDTHSVNLRHLVPAG